MAERAREAGVKPERRVLEAGAGLCDGLIDTSYEPGTHVVTGLKRRSPVGKLLLGSTSQRVLREAGWPVHVVKVRAGPSQ